MSTFTIYAFVITGLYISYMAVTIIMDLFGKKGQVNDSAEVFDDLDMVGDTEEQSTIVDETDNGYSFHPSGVQQPEISDDEQSEEKEVEDPEEDDESSQLDTPVDVNPNDDSLLEQESMENIAEYEEAMKIKKQMETIHPTYQEEHLSDDFAFVMSQPIAQRSRILKTIVNI